MGHILHVKIGLLINSLKFSVNSQFTLSKRQFLTPQKSPSHLLETQMRSLHLPNANISGYPPCGPVSGLNVQFLLHKSVKKNKNHAP